VRRQLQISFAIAALAALVFAALPAPASAHGGEDLTEQPARALVQQALGLLTQQDNVVEAQERLEAALESEDTENVEVSSVRKALAALEDGDKDEAVEQMNAALAPDEEPEPSRTGDESQAAPEEEAGHAAGEDPMPSEPADEAFEDHANAVEPDRGTAEWIGLAVGLGLIGVGGAALGLRRERP
jgi:hypothetical protein